MADLDALINEIPADWLSQPLSLSTQVAHTGKQEMEPFTEAKGHNRDFLGDKTPAAGIRLPHKN